MGSKTTDSVVGWLRGHLAGHRPDADNPWESRAETRERLSAAASCDLYGRTLLAGEWTQRLVDDDGSERYVCSLCARPAV